MNMEGTLPMPQHFFRVRNTHLGWFAQQHTRGSKVVWRWWRDGAHEFDTPAEATKVCRTEFGAAVKAGTLVLEECHRYPNNPDHVKVIKTTPWQ